MPIPVAAYRFMNNKSSCCILWKHIKTFRLEVTFFVKAA